MRGGCGEGVHTCPAPWTMVWPSMGPLSLDPSPLRGILIDLVGKVMGWKWNGSVEEEMCAIDVYGGVDERLKFIIYEERWVCSLHRSGVMTSVASVIVERSGDRTRFWKGQQQFAAGT